MRHWLFLERPKAAEHSGERTWWRLHLGDSQIALRLVRDRKPEATLSGRTLTDRPWAIIGPLVPGKAGDRGWTGNDNRCFVDVMLWFARAATPCRDVPLELGNGRTVHARIRHWTLADVWEWQGSENDPVNHFPAAMFSKRQVRSQTSNMSGVENIWGFRL